MLSQLPDELIHIIFSYVKIIEYKQCLMTTNKNYYTLLHNEFDDFIENTIRLSVNNEWKIIGFILNKDYYAILYLLPEINKYFVYLIIHYSIVSNNVELFNIVIKDIRTAKLICNLDLNYYNKQIKHYFFDKKKELLYRL